MSLEESIAKLSTLIQANTSAVALLTEAVKGTSKVSSVGKATAARAVEETAPPVAAVEAAPPKAEPKPEAKAPTFDDVRAAVNAAVEGKGREFVVNVLKEFNLPKASAATPEQYPALLAKLTA